MTNTVRLLASEDVRGCQRCEYVNSRNRALILRLSTDRIESGTEFSGVERGGELEDNSPGHTARDYIRERIDSRNYV